MTIRIASRSSKLALAQVEEFVKKFGISDYKIIKVKTEGDIKSANGETLFDKAHFVSDVQKCLLNSEADIAVHSAKDTPAKETAGLLRYFLPSQSNEDVLILREEDKFNSEMKLGTSSLRRQLQAKHHLNAINIVNLSGNVDTRLEKLSQGEYDCIILAKAGLARLKLLNELQYEVMDWSTASGQGFLCIEVLNDPSADIYNFLLKSIREIDSNLGKNISTERSILEAINAGCLECIMLNHKGEVCEASGDNIFIVSDKIIKTPPVNSGALVGLTRNKVLELASINKYKVSEETISRYDLYTADEVFLTGTAAEIISVVEIDKRTIGSGKPGLVTKELSLLYSDYAKESGISFD